MKCQNYCVVNNMGRAVWRKEEIEYLASICKGKLSKEIHQLMNEHFNKSWTLSQVICVMRRHKITTGVDCTFKKGTIPPNKGKKYPGKINRTTFQKGHAPVNRAPIGTEVIVRGGYIKIKVGQPNIWELKHRYIWEKVNGPILKDKRLFFLDQNKTNCNIENLCLIDKADGARLNQNKLVTNDANINRTNVLVAKVLTKIGRKEKEYKEKHNTSNI